MLRWRRKSNEFATSCLDPQTDEPAMSRNVVPCDQPTGQRNDFELIPTVYMESQHSVDGPTSRDFSPIYIVRELWAPEVGSRWSDFQKSCLFGKNDPLRQNLQKIVPKEFTWTRIHTLCANFMKLGWLEIGKVVRYLPDKKNKISACSHALASAPIEPKICQGHLQTI